jgi:hypothetical protein
MAIAENKRQKRLSTDRLEQNREKELKGTIRELHRYLSILSPTT